MYIHEAVAASKDTIPMLPFIRRRSWPYNKVCHEGYKIRVTNAPGGCVAYIRDLPPEKWVPSMDDLIADDWDVCL